MALRIFAALFVTALLADVTAAEETYEPEELYSYVDYAYEDRRNLRSRSSFRSSYSSWSSRSYSYSYTSFGSYYYTPSSYSYFSYYYSPSYYSLGLSSGYYGYSSYYGYAGTGNYYGNYNSLTRKQKAALMSPCNKAY